MFSASCLRNTFGDNRLLEKQTCKTKEPHKTIHILLDKWAWQQKRKIGTFLSGSLGLILIPLCSLLFCLSLCLYHSLTYMILSYVCTQVNIPSSRCLLNTSVHNKTRPALSPGAERLCLPSVPHPNHTHITHHSKPPKNQPNAKITWTKTYLMLTHTHIKWCESLLYM